MIKKDWLMRQIEGMTQMLAFLLFHKREATYQLPAKEARTEADGLFLRLDPLVREGRIGDAENLLFEELNPDDQRYLELALDFYQKLNALSDPALAAGGFEREEIEEGLRDVCKRFGVSFPGL